MPVCLYASTHIRYDDILVAKCVRVSGCSVCVIDCMSCWPNVSGFSLELWEKSVISSKAPFEKPHKPVIAREKAGQPAKANTWEGIGNIVNSRVTHSVSRRRPRGGRGQDVGVSKGWKVVADETENCLQNLRHRDDNSESLRKMILPSTTSKLFIPMLKLFLNRDCVLWSPATAFMCWHNIFLVLSNKSRGLFS